MVLMMHDNYYNYYNYYNDTNVYYNSGNDIRCLLDIHGYYHIIAINTMIILIMILMLVSLIIA